MNLQRFSSFSGSMTRFLCMLMPKEKDWEWLSPIKNVFTLFAYIHSQRLFPSMYPLHTQKKWFLIYYKHGHLNFNINLYHPFKLIQWILNTIGKWYSSTSIKSMMTFSKSNFIISPHFSLSSVLHSISSTEYYSNVMYYLLIYLLPNSVINIRKLQSRSPGSLEIMSL